MYRAASDVCFPQVLSHQRRPILIKRNIQRDGNSDSNKRTSREECPHAANAQARGCVGGRGLLRAWMSVFVLSVLCVRVCVVCAYLCCMCVCVHANTNSHICTYIQKHRYMNSCICKHVYVRKFIYHFICLFIYLSGYTRV